jgi:heme-degrading monooxygenase HmoA
MRGTNTGSFAGLPPTGRSVVLRGADFISVGQDGIESVEGYFNPGSVPQQIGMQILVQPTEVGPFTFGNSVRVGGEIDGSPGAFSITSLQPKNAEDADRVRELSRETAAQMIGLDGFMGWVGVAIGDRMLTITAWSSPENSRQVMRLPAHKDATRGFFGTDLADGGWVSVWSPERIGPVWSRCHSCDAMANTDTDDETCSCGAAAPEQRTYW